MLTFLAVSTNTLIWKNKRPSIFTTKVATLRTKVAALSPLIAQQENTITGFAEQKEREAMDVEDLADEIGSALAGYFEDGGREGDAATVDYAASTWHAMRENSLLEKARLVHSKLTDAVEADATCLAPYGLDAADLLKEIEEYAEIIKTPQTAKVTRKTLTAALRPSFREVSAILVSLERLVPRFGSDSEGKLFAAGWKNARRIPQTGSRPGDVPPPPNL